MMMPSFIPAERAPCCFRRAGFTLIELLIVICIIGLLTLLAYPQFNDSVIKAKRAAAKAALLRAMQQQERYYAQHQRYVAYQDAPTGTESDFIWFSGSTAGTSAHQISAAACTGQTLAQCVELSAIPGAALVDRSFHDALCGTLTLNSRGQRSVGGKPLSEAAHACQ